ncbi:MAG: LemA family protein [Ruminiclostridium sp.]|nr:LemA family protein [Ruminiclostridium sp.]
MLPTIITIIIIAAAIILWVIYVRRKLVALDENICNAMIQIGVQLSSRFDALTALLDLSKGCIRHENETLMEEIKSTRREISGKSTPDEVLHQEQTICDTLGGLAIVTEQYPELRASQSYIKAMDAVHVFENMMRTSRLIYNVSVNKLNREIRKFPVSLVAGMLGFREREYL